MNGLRVDDKTAWFAIKYILFLALVIVAALFVAMGVVPFLVRLETMGTFSRVGHGLFAILSALLLRFAWRKLGSIPKQEKASREADNKAAEDKALAEQNRYQALTNNDKLREDERNKKTNIEATRKAVKGARNRMIMLNCFFACGAALAVYFASEEARVLTAIMFGSMLIFIMIATTVIYKKWVNAKKLDGDL